MDKYVPLRQACSFTGLTSQTLRSWAKKDKIKIINTPQWTNIVFPEKPTRFVW